MTPLPPAENYLVSNNNAPEEKDLAAKVKDLEAALKKINDKDKAAKEKAAGAPSVKLSGFLWWDSVWFGQNAQSRSLLGDAQDTTFLSNARLCADGEAFDVGFYKVEIDFANRTDLTTGTTSAHTHTLAGMEIPAFKDTYIGIKELPLVGKVFVGYFKEPVGLEEITSDKFQMFMSRSFTSALTPNRQIGIMAQNNWAGQDGTWSLGAFRKSTNGYPPYVANDNGLVDGSARITYLPWYDEATNGRGLLHLGSSYTYRDYNDTTVRVAYRPEVACAGPYVVDTRVSGIDTLTGVANEHLFGAEMAFVYGAFSIQSEFLGAQFNRTSAGDAFVSAAYVQMSYFLTGENRVYDRSKGIFNRVKPFTNFFRVRTEDGLVETGSGAWELVYRWSCLNGDTAAANVYGGYASDHTMGVNWYLNPNMKLMGEWVHSDVSPNGQRANTFIDAVMCRAAVDF